MVSMYDIDEPTKTLIEGGEESIQESRVLTLHTSVDLDGVVYDLFHKER